MKRKSQAVTVCRLCGALIAQDWWNEDGYCSRKCRERYRDSAISGARRGELDQDTDRRGRER